MALICLSKQCFPDGSRSAAAGMKGFGVASSGLGWRSIQAQNLLMCSSDALVQETALIRIS